MNRQLTLEKKSITPEEINQLPLGAFEGNIIVASEREHVNTIFEEINAQRWVGFDTETKPVFVKGHRNKVAILQIALPEKVFLVRVQATGLTPKIVHFLQL